MFGYQLLVFLQTTTITYFSLTFEEPDPFDYKMWPQQQNVKVVILLELHLIYHTKHDMKHFNQNAYLVVLPSLDGTLLLCASGLVVYGFSYIFQLDYWIYLSLCLQMFKQSCAFFCFLSWFCFLPPQKVKNFSLAGQEKQETKPSGKKA